MPLQGAANNELSLLRSLIDHIPDVVYLKDTEHRFTAANKAAATLFGEDSPTKLIGKTDFDYFPKELADIYHRDERKLFKSGKALEAKEEAGVDSDGKKFTYVVTKTPIKDHTGKIVGLAGIGRDISKALHDKRLIELERKQLQTLIDNIPDPIYFKDTEGHYQNGNSSFYRGLDASCLVEVLGKTDFDYLDPELAERFQRDEIELFKSGKGFTKEESGATASGQRVFYQTTKTPIFDRNSKKPIGMVGISRDITETKTAREALKARAEELTQTLDQLKQAQSQLVQSEKMASLGVLTAGIAHEINNPINFVYAGVNSMGKDFADVKTVVEQLKDLPQASDPTAAIAKLQQTREQVDFDEAFEALEETLKDIKLGATRITEIVAGLSKFSRLGQEDWDLSNLHEDLEGVLVLLKNKYKTHIKIERDFATDLPPVVCFPGKLNQAFMNIIGNAIDAIDSHASSGTIRISTRAQAGSVFISIKDDGTGMDHQVREKIFDPFFTTKSIGKGTGLGLSITYSIIQDHNGNLSLTTESGKGSTFIIQLPIEQASYQHNEAQV